MDKQNQALNSLSNLLSNIEVEIKRARIMIKNISEGNLDNLEEWWEDIKDIASKLMNYDEWEEVRVIEWVYDWYFMIGSDEKKYPVPMNYSSKTKLIPGDVMKLRVMPDGKLVYKLIWPAPRNYIKATLSKSDDDKYISITDDGVIYDLNQAAVTFFKWKAWDELSIIINPESSIKIAAIEAVISK